MQSLKESHEKKNVVLMFPPFGDYIYGDGWVASETPVPPLGLLYLAAPLAKEGYNVRFIDFTVDKLTRANYLDLIKSADFYLISCYTGALHNIAKIIDDIKSQNSNAFILAGGPYCNETGNHMAGSHVTVFGEADLVIADLLNALRKNEALEGFPGLSYGKEGQLVRNPGKLLVDDLDKLEIPALHLAANKKYGRFFSLQFDGIVPVASSRGCPFHCTFCTYMRTQYRERPVDKVIAELKLRVKEGAAYIAFYDDNFLVNKNRVAQLMDKIIENELKIKIIFMGRVDLVDPELYRKLKKAGVVMMAMGIESANQDVLDFYNKKTTVEKIKQAVITADRMGIITAGFLMIGAPMEEKRHFDNTKKFFKEIPLDFIHLNVLKYIRGSMLWDEARKKGLLSEDDIMVTANRQLSNYTTGELNTIQDDLIKSFYNNPGRILRIILKFMALFGLKIFYMITKAFFSKSIYRTGETVSGFKHYGWEKLDSVR